MKRVAASLVAAAAGAPMATHAKPPRPSIHKRAQEAKKACQPYHEHIRRAEERKRLPRHTLTALGFSESGCKANAHNKDTDARGWGQQTPGGAVAVRRILRTRGETPWFKHSDAWDARKSINAAAELLAYGLEVCGGLAEAIRLYNTRSCGKPNAFARGVLRLAAAIRALTGEEPTS